MATCHTSHRQLLSARTGCLSSWWVSKQLAGALCWGPGPEEPPRNQPEPTRDPAPRQGLKPSSSEGDWLAPTNTDSCRTSHPVECVYWLDPEAGFHQGRHKVHHRVWDQCPHQQRSPAAAGREGISCCYDIQGFPSAPRSDTWGRAPFSVRRALHWKWSWALIITSSGAQGPGLLSSASPWAGMWPFQGKGPFSGARPAHMTCKVLNGPGMTQA